ncbi:MAG: serine hydrolase, partial [Bacteroidetes bacterium]|nr:serine hydrolase [Bacteroidota bacterium]
MKQFKILFLLIAIFKMNSVVAQIQEIKSIDSLMNLFIINNCLNGDVLISENSKSFYKKTIGYRDNATKEILKPNSLFNIGSVSKPFTSVAILQLQENKMLNIDDLV